MARRDLPPENGPRPEAGLRVRDVGEFGLLDLLGVEGRRFRSGWVGPGDDAAVLPPPEHSIAVTTDLLLENVHFRRSTATPEQIGHKALAVNLSDLASMGARPIAYTLSAAFPPDLETAWVERLYGGLGEASRAYGCPLIGGDTSSSATIFLSLTLLGECVRRGPVLRSTAHVGEDVFLSGRTGESAAGLAVLERGLDREEPVFARLVERHLKPEPRLALGRELARRGLVSSMIDVSDGLAQDAGHLARQSGLGVRILADLLPRSELLEEGAFRLGLDPLALALAGGEDYELLFTAPQDRRKTVFEAAAMIGVPLALIGDTVIGAGVEVLGPGGTPLPLTKSGFDHFR